MLADQWALAKEIAVEAMTMNAPERVAFLDKTCGGARELRVIVDAFLGNEEDMVGFLQSPRSATVDAICAQFAHPYMIGQRVGNYRLTELIDTGGTGAVYRGNRTDEEYEKTVAVKLLYREFSTGLMLRRFQRERRALAKFEHPFIARLLDGGTTEDGIPYFAMEYVEGEPIDQHCDKLCLSINARLRIFRRVCEAVHYAHQNLVIHRDLKPSNILVTHDGIPKLLDFGIAKLMSSMELDNRERTSTLMHALTTRYASPEQIQGGVITTATDVFSLGVVLYELLTGHPIHSFVGRPHYEQAKMICERDPIPPSERVVLDEMSSAAADVQSASNPARLAPMRGSKPHQLRRRLRGDLDNIVCKALQRDPSRRYASVQEFSDDIERFLLNRPVIARKDTLAYRASRFARRNKLGVIGSAVLILALVTGIIGTSYGMRKARIAANAEIAARAEAEEVSRFLRDTLSSANPYRRGRNATILELLEDASLRINRELVGKPGVEAAVRLTIAQTYEGLLMWNEAVHHSRIALSLNRELYGNDAASVATCMTELGYALTFQEKPQAIQVLREALTLNRKHFAEKTLQVAEVKGALGYALSRVANPPRWEEAEQLLRESLETCVDRGSFRGRALTSFGLAVVLSSRGGRPEEAERLFHDAEEIFEAYPDGTDRNYAFCLYSHAIHWRRLRRYDEEKKLLRKALSISPVGFNDVHARAMIWRLMWLELRSVDSNRLWRLFPSG